MSIADKRPMGPGECAGIAWRLFVAAPGQHVIAGILFLLIFSMVPILLPGPLWVGLCAMALAALRGEAVGLEQFFAPFSDQRARAAWIYGLLLTVVMIGSQLIGISILIWAFMSAMSGMHSGALAQQAFVFEVVLAFLVMLLPYVFMAYYLFPAGFYIANGETDCGAALRRGIGAVRKRRAFWSAFWGTMMLGHLLGMLACCVGLAIVLPWNCIAMGAGLMSQDPSLASVPTQSRATVPNLPGH